MKELSVHYVGVCGALCPMGDFRRTELRAAVDSFRFLAHATNWQTVWHLKRGKKTIARIDNRNGGFPKSQSTLRGPATLKTDGGLLTNHGQIVRALEAGGIRREIDSPFQPQLGGRHA